MEGNKVGCSPRAAARFRWVYPNAKFEVYRKEAALECLVVHQAEAQPVANVSPSIGLVRPTSNVRTAQEGPFRDITARKAAPVPIVRSHHIRELALPDASEERPQPLAGAYLSNDSRGVLRHVLGPFEKESRKLSAYFGKVGTVEALQTPPWIT
jgi:hypothetical protein